MRIAHLFFILLPALTSCQININLYWTPVTGYYCSYSGSDSAIISSKEELSFRITNHILRNGIQSHSGGRPDDVWLHNPTEGIGYSLYNLYSVKNWPEVRRIIKPVSMEVIHMKNESHGLKTYDVNSEPFDAKDHFYTKWYTASPLENVADISYTVSSWATVSLPPIISAWGQDDDRTRKTVTNKDIKRILEHEVKDAVLQVNVTYNNVKVLIEYEATLDGDVACNYPEGYRGEYNRNYKINNVLRAGGYPTTVKFSQIVTFEYYYYGKIVVLNNSTKEVIRTHDKF